MRRWISLVLTVAMLMPAMAACAEGTMATWLSPQPGQIVSGGNVEVAIGYNTQSKLKVSSLELYVDGQFISRKVLRVPESRGVCSFAWDTTRVEQGTHNIVVKVFAGDQMISKLFGTGTVGPNGSRKSSIDVRPPVVTFAGIKSGDILKGVTTVTLNAVDDSGQSPMVSLLVDDVLKLLKNTPPYSYSLDTTTYADGDHSLKTYAYDGAGNRSDPAVAKVTFRNGAPKPIVTTLSVDQSPKTDVVEASISKAVPPSIDASAEPKIRKSAARAEKFEASTSPVKPVVAEPKVKPKPIAVAPKPVTVAPKLVTVAPKLVTVASKPVIAAKIAPAAPKLDSNLKAVLIEGKSSLKQTHAQPKVDTQMAAVVPSIEATPPVAQRHAPVLSAKPVRMASAASDMTVRKVSAKPEPAQAASISVNTAVPKVAAPKCVANNTAPKPISTSVKSQPQPAKHIALNQQVAKLVTGELRTVDSVMPTIVSEGTLSKSDLKRVQVAMAPDLRSPIEKMQTSPAISCPPSIPRSTKAKIEKTTIPYSGKVKARDFFEKMGGALFWDPSTHTVTACVGSMVLEMRIGSKMAKVNGHEFPMTTAPQIVDNRTVFDAGSFAQACAIVENLSKSAAKPS